jgi:hypothetical protein
VLQQQPLAPACQRHHQQHQQCCVAVLGLGYVLLLLLLLLMLLLLVAFPELLLEPYWPPQNVPLALAQGMQCPGLISCQRLDVLSCCLLPLLQAAW